MFIASFFKQAVKLKREAENRYTNIFVCFISLVFFVDYNAQKIKEVYGLIFLGTFEEL
jgi:hypothetical protein